MSTLRSLTVIGLMGLMFTAPALATEWRGGSAEDRAAMAAIVEVWKNAYATGDGQAVADGYDPGGFVMAEGAPIAGPDTVSRNLTRTFETNTIDMLLDVEEMEFNGTWAFLNGRFASKRTPKDPASTAEPHYHAGRFFTLLRKTPDGWKVWRNMDTSSPDAADMLAELKAKP